MTFQEYCDEVGFVAANHQKRLIEKLDYLKDGGVAIVAWPPRSGKTTIANLFKGWLQKLHPDWSIGICNYLSNRDESKSWFPSCLAQAFIVDDYFKNITCEELKTVKRRQTERNKIEQSILNYVDSKAPVLIIQTRMHYDDLFAWLSSGHHYYILHQQEAIMNIFRDREDGVSAVSYWPEQYPLERLLEIKKTISRKDWETMYQQCPSDEQTSSMVRWYLR